MIVWSLEGVELRCRRRNETKSSYADHDLRAPVPFKLVRHAAAGGAVWRNPNWHVCLRVCWPPGCQRPVSMGRGRCRLGLDLDSSPPAYRTSKIDVRRRRFSGRGDSDTKEEARANKPFLFPPIHKRYPPPPPRPFPERLPPAFFSLSLNPLIALYSAVCVRCAFAFRRSSEVSRKRVARPVRPLGVAAFRRCCSVSSEEMVSHA